MLRLPRSTLVARNDEFEVDSLKPQTSMPMDVPETHEVLRTK